MGLGVPLPDSGAIEVQFQHHVLETADNGDGIAWREGVKEPPSGAFGVMYGCSVKSRSPPPVRIFLGTFLAAPAVPNLS
jgi:hypothetical protein